MRLERIDVASAAATGAMAATAAYTWRYGPEGPVPMHMGLDGAVDRWGTAEELALVMASCAAITGAVALFCAWSKRDSRTADHAARSPVGFLTGRVIGLAAPGLAVALMAALAFGGVRPGEDQTSMLRLTMGVASLMFLVIGGLLGKTAPNWFVGVRTYWSLTSRLAWDKSNRLAGRLMFWIGLAGFLSAPFVPLPFGLQALIAGVIAAALWSVVESWRVWRIDPDRAAH